MNLKLTLFTTVRVLRQLKADPRSMAILLVVPTLLLLLFYYIYEQNQQLFSFIAIAMIAILPLSLMFIVSSVTMQRERANGTLERVWTTRLHRADLIGGYALAFGFLGILQSLILVTVMDVFLNVNTQASWGTLLIIAGTTGVTGLSLGFFGSAFACSEFQAVQLMPVLIIPQILLCGLLMPRAELPDLLRWISNALPLSYAVDAATEASRSGLSSGVVANIAICWGFALIFLALAATTMPVRGKKRQHKLPGSLRS